MDEFILLLMSYLLTFLFCIILICGITLPLNSFADGQPVINEFLPHPNDGNKEWVELYVPDGSSVNGYWIDDDTDFTSDTGNSAKKQITSFIQGSDSQHVVFELSSSMFNNDGDTVALFSPDGTLIDHYSYSKDPGVDISIGRTPDMTGDFQVLASSTKGSPNSPPQPTPTPTPEPTDKPTKEPKPTETPKPVKSQSVTITSQPVKSLAANQGVLSASTTDFDSENSSLSPTQIASDDARPTSILRENITISPKKDKVNSQKRILIKGISDSLPQMVAIIVGGLLFVSCGILIFLKKKEIWIWRQK